LWSAGAVPATIGALVVYTGPLIFLGMVTREDATMVFGWIRDAVPGGERGGESAPRNNAPVE